MEAMSFIALQILAIYSLFIEDFMLF
jgi:hypothetical protein